MSEHAIKARIEDVVKNYQEAFYPEFVPSHVAAAIMLEFNVEPKRAPSKPS